MGSKLKSITINGEDLAKVETNTYYINKVVHDAIAEKLGDDSDKLLSFSYTIQVDFQMEEL